MNKKLKKLLLEAGLSEKESLFYLYVLENPGVSIFEIAGELPFGKSSVYRSYDHLKKIGLVKECSERWQSNLRAQSLSVLIKKLESEKRKIEGVINSLKTFELANGATPEAFSEFEKLDEEQTFERYFDLSKRKDWTSMFAYGNWEDFNNQTRSIVGVEKQFIKNRLKHGGRAFVAVTKGGPNTSQIVDYNNEIDNKEDRRSISVAEKNVKPIWINVFEGNNFLHLWNLDERQKIVSTFMECKPLADFYKEFIYSKVA